MDRELKKKAIISIAVHVAAIIFLVSYSFVSCRRISARSISPFIDLEISTGPMPGGGGVTAQDGLSVKAAKTRQDDAFPAPAPKSFRPVEVSKKLVSPKTAPEKQLSANEIKRRLAEGVASAVSPLPGADSGVGSGPGADGMRHPYAWFYLQVRAIMYAAWQSPSALIGKKGLVTSVEIHVQRDGRITSKKIITPSGNAQMDESVLRALEAVSRLPELPAGLGGLSRDIRIDFELTDMAMPPGE